VRVALGSREDASAGAALNEIRYARAGDGTHLAVQVLEADPGHDSDHDVLMVTGGLIPLEVFEDDPGFLRLVEGLRALGRVIVFDRRGIGLSDPITDWGQSVLDQWADDIAVVVRTIEPRNLTVFGWDGFGIAPRFAARSPDLVHRLVLFQPVIGSVESWGARIAEMKPQVQANLTGGEDLLAAIAPSRAADPAFREWYARAGRVGASPATAARIWESVFHRDSANQQLDEVRAPTLLLHRPESTYVPSDVAGWVASRLSDVKLVGIEGDDHWPFIGNVDAVIAEIADFVVGERRVPPPERTLEAVLFTDLVESTRRAADLGDAQWKLLLDRHDNASRAAVTRCGGRLVKSTGDGVLALFPSAGAAVRAADRLREHLAVDGLEIRVGVHVGDVDHRGDDVSGLAVHVAARVMAAAGAGELLVSPSVVAAVAGEAGHFESAGRYDLKGVPGSWELFRHHRPD
jgi:class 3 adenylate cyclase/pimeloyl-ACP methyl ester carboxylesterase